MSRSEPLVRVAVAAMLTLLSWTSIGSEPDEFSEPAKFGVGVPIPPTMLEQLSTTIGPDGAGLPVGQGTVHAGELVYAAKCLACHGESLQGTALGPALVGGRGSLAGDSPKKTVASFWPFATSVFSYIRNTMPTTAPGTLTGDECYALMSYILAFAGIIPPDAVMDQESLPKVRMPNRDGFVADPRPDAGSGGID